MAEDKEPRPNTADDKEQYEYVYVDADDDSEGEYVYIDDDSADDAAHGAAENDGADAEYEYVYTDDDDDDASQDDTPSPDDAIAPAAAAGAVGAAAGAAANPSAAPADSVEETEEQKLARLKQEKHNRIRRNLRIIALAVAAYYFVSAGYTWYQEKQAENAQTSSQMIKAANQDVFADPAAFRERFNRAINAQRSSLPTANANDSTEGFVAVLSPAIELRGVMRPNEQQIAYMQLQTRYPDALPPESLTALKAFIAACENTTDLSTCDEILQALDIAPQPDANPAGKVFAPVQAQSPGIRYELSFKEDAIDELTLKAFPRG